MATRPRLRPFAVVAALVATLLAGLGAAPAYAHSLDSSTISTHVTADGVDATISIARDALADAVGTAGTDAGTDADIVDYLGAHLRVTGADGTEWTETFSAVTRESVEGIESVVVDVAFDPGGADTSTFVLTYDAVIEAVPGHEAVVVLTDPAGEVSTPGVLTAADGTLTVTTGTGPATGIGDMVGYGFHHVLAGADHLLFLVTLLLTAPAVAVAGRWRRRTAAGPTVRSLLGVVTSFTLGHSVTLIASALGWVQVPTRPVEVLVALSVGVAAVHAVRPLARHGENAIAAGFGLVHGLAFAGILADLGLDGAPSLGALLAFNVGVELAQLAATALLFPPLYLLARTRHAATVRIAGAAVALAAATGWVIERLTSWPSPLGPVEDAAIAHPWTVVLGLAALAAATWAAGARHRPAGQLVGAPKG